MECGRLLLKKGYKLKILNTINFRTYSEVMLVIFEGFMMDDLTEEQAGQLMLSLTNVMMYNNE